MDFQGRLIVQNWPSLLAGLGETVAITLAALLIGLLVGALLCTARLARPWAGRQAASGVIAFFRTTPEMILLFWAYFCVPEITGSNVPALAAGVEPVMTEIPAGMCEKDAAPAATVRREAVEEMGLETDLLHPIGDFVLSAGASDEHCVLFAGRVHAPVAGPDGIAGHAGLNTEQEDIQVRVMPAEVAIEKAVAGQYPNSITAIALLWLAAKRDWLRREWGAA